MASLSLYSSSRQDGSSRQQAGKRKRRDPVSPAPQDADDQAAHQLAAMKLAAQRQDARRAKARERMAMHVFLLACRRAKIKALPLHEQEEYLERARESRAKYRESNRGYLRFAAWGHRNRKYIAMDGNSHYEEYMAKSALRERRAERKKKLHELHAEARARDAAEDAGNARNAQSEQDASMVPGPLWTLRPQSRMPEWLRNPVSGHDGDGHAYAPMIEAEEEEEDYVLSQLNMQQ
ncbi:hypothetical protein C8R44DRAFT_872371 [Mycena epipterygia]|nr:hypothetical protein C8R44DRAFT_872371 [Mycena epipterygia]